MYSPRFDYISSSTVHMEASSWRPGRSRSHPGHCHTLRFIGPYQISQKRALVKPIPPSIPPSTLPLHRCALQPAVHVKLFCFVAFPYRLDGSRFPVLWTRLCIMFGGRALFQRCIFDALATSPSCPLVSTKQDHPGSPPLLTFVYFSCINF